MTAKNERSTGVEWVGGVTTMPAYVTGEGEPYRPEALIWMGADGAILGSIVGKPGQVLDMASQSLQDTIVRPAWGRPHAPARVRVASPELAAALRTAHPSIDIVSAPTPEVDAVLAAMREQLGEEAPEEQSYLSLGVDPDAMAAFFRAAAGLFRAKPWNSVPTDSSLVTVSIKDLGVKDAVISVIGQMQESFGFLLLSSARDFDAFRDAAEAIERGQEPALPPHFALNFERAADLIPALRKEVAQHRWEVAGPAAYPWAMVVDADMVARPPTPLELRIAEALALALPQLLAATKLLLAAWTGGRPVSRTYAVQTHAGQVEVAFRVG